MCARAALPPLKRSLWRGAPSTSRPHSRLPLVGSRPRTRAGGPLEGASARPSWWVVNPPPSQWPKMRAKGPARPRPLGLCLRGFADPGEGSSAAELFFFPFVFSAFQHLLRRPRAEWGPRRDSQRAARLLIQPNPAAPTRLSSASDARDGGRGGGVVPRWTVGLAQCPATPTARSPYQNSTDNALALHTQTRRLRAIPPVSLPGAAPTHCRRVPRAGWPRPGMVPTPR